MKKTNIKMKQYSIIAVLVVISITLIGIIYSTSQNKNDLQVKSQAVEEDADVLVEELDYSDDEQDDRKDDVDSELDKVEVEAIEIESQVDEEVSEVTVEPIVTDKKGTIETSVVEIEEVNVPVAEEPDKPDMTPPEVIPETSDDLTDPDNVPEYDEEETTFVPEPEPEEQEDEVRGSNLVPDSENPFLQDDIPSNGDGGEQQGSDFYEDGNVAGEGDKF